MDVDLTKFKGGVAVITGAGSGIGEALANRAAQAGMKVVVAEISEQRGMRVASEIQAAGGDALFVQTDVTDFASMQTLAEKTRSAFGDVTLLVNNAGISIMGAICDISAEDWDKGIKVNLYGVIHGVKAFAPAMTAANKEAFIVNVCSLASFSTAPGLSPYFTTKHAVLSFTESLYLEMKAQPTPIHVAVAVPALVTTRIFDDSILATDRDVEQQQFLSAYQEQSGMPADEAAERILAGAVQGNFWISTHPEQTEMFSKGRAKYLDALSLPAPTDPEMLNE